jgi:hypothetical protein
VHRTRKLRQHRVLIEIFFCSQLNHDGWIDHGHRLTSGAFCSRIELARALSEVRLLFFLESDLSVVAQRAVSFFQTMSQLNAISKRM